MGRAIPRPTRGTIGHVACFSLMNSKHIGDGEVVASSDSRLGPALQKFGDKGSDRTTAGFMWDQTAVLASKSITVAAVALPIPKMMMVISPAVAEVMGLSLPMTGTRCHWAKSWT